MTPEKRKRLEAYYREQCANGDCDCQDDPGAPESPGKELGPKPLSSAQVDNLCFDVLAELEKEHDA